MTDLEKLIAAIEAGDWNSVTSQPSKETGFHDWVLHIDEIMDRGDLNAAQVLHDEFVPDALWDIWRVPIFDDDARRFGCNLSGVDTVYSITPARAWLLAIMRLVKEGKAEE